MKFSLGEKVGFVNEPGFGFVKAQISFTKYLVENEDGMELNLFSNQLVKIYSEDYRDQIIVKDNSEEIERKVTKQKQVIPEIDLHIEEFSEDFKFKTNGEILQFQLRKADEFIQRMLRSERVSFVIIHGVGEGVLRSEVRSLLKKYAGTSFSDADELQYGRGATLVQINYKLR